MCSLRDGANAEKSIGIQGRGAVPWRGCRKLRLWKQEPHDAVASENDIFGLFENIVCDDVEVHLRDPQEVFRVVLDGSSVDLERGEMP